MKCCKELGDIMDIGVIVFAYNRSLHLKKVLSALRINKEISQIYIFQDGLKCEEHRNEWEKTQKIIKDITWCKIIYTLSSYNKGLANSIIDGVNIVLEDNDAVAVLEDDCVPHPLFMEYVTKCLEKYQNDKRVFSINGYAWNVDVQSNGTDAYFAGRAGSWGWAIWKDRWLTYQQDYKILARIQQDLYKSRQLDIWGADLESYLRGNIDGKCDSWAVFMALKCIEESGFCPTPYFSLIDNIGFDGTGIHCGNSKVSTDVRNLNDMRGIVLPDIIAFPENYEIAYADQFRWTSPEVKLSCYNKILSQWNLLFQKGVRMEEYFERRSIKSIAIWGRGSICSLLIDELQNKVKVKFIVESNPKDDVYKNIPVIGVDKIADIIQVIVVIPIYDMERIRKRINNSYVRKLVGIDEVLQYLSDEQKDY